MSRLAQFKLVAAKGDGDAIASCAHALFAEIAELSDELLFPNFEVLALSKVLTVLGIADHLPDWIDLFIRFITIVEADKELGDWKGNFERASRTEGISLYGFLFSLGATGISSVRRLEEIMEALDHVGLKKRNILLQDYERQSGGYRLFVDGPLLQEHRRGEIDPVDAAARYQRMAALARKWSIR